MVKISSWGRLGQWEHNVLHFVDCQHAASVIHINKHGIAYGMGRSYGDECLNPGGVLWKTTKLDHFISFDNELGVLECEAGVLLRDIQQLLVPRGWMLPVTPGTQLITIGGAIANDVHGKNHHVMGSFGNHVLALRLVRTDGEVIDCGPQNQVEWFSATVGGMGLTGLITQVSIQLRRVASPWLEAENLPYSDISQFFDLADASESLSEHTVSWLDCLTGRGIFMRGNHVDIKNGPKPTLRKRTIPLVPPVSLVNRLSLRPFNFAYYHMQAQRKGCTTVHYEPFFYPLDNLLEWNRIYGPRGFYQYQSVVARSVGQEAIRVMLKEISKYSDGSFLAVLKTFGNVDSVGMMSFPLSGGVTLALDFPNKGVRTEKLFSRLDAILGGVGGRIYPAKDARMPRDLFEAGYPQLNEFIKYRDPGISSAMSRRLMGS